MEGLSAIDDPVGRLAGAYRMVYPRLAASYERHLREMSETSDSASVRSTRIVLDDLCSDWRDGELALQDLIVSSESSQRAAEVVSALECLLVC